jgi:branched-chain amino acid transport system substrate-binding protein
VTTKRNFINSGRPVGSSGGVRTELGLARRTPGAALVLLILCMTFPWGKNGCTYGDDFRFGIIAPLSGVLAEYGTALRNGIELAREDHQSEMTHIDVRMEDSQWDPKTAVSAFNLLAHQYKAHLVFNWGNPTSDAVVPIAERQRIPLLAMSSNPAPCLEKTYIIRTVASGIELGEPLGRELLARGYRRIGIVVAENSYVKGLLMGVERGVKAGGGIVETLGTFDLDAQDFRSTVATLKSGKYDAIGVFLISGQVRTFFKQIREQKVLLPSFGADFLGSKTEIEASGPAIEGAIFPDLGVAPSFRKRYMERFGNDIQISFAANGYDVTALVARTFGVSKQGTLNPIDIVERLKTAPPVQGAHGGFSFRQSREFGAAFASTPVVREVRGDEILDLDPRS